MSIYSYLKEDHEEIKSIMNDIADLGDEGSEERLSLFNHLKEKLILHSKAEEEAFYKPLKECGGEIEEEVEHGKEEHEEAESLLQELTDSSLSGAAWMQKFKKLKEAVEHHIQEEESDVFSDAQKVLSSQQAEAMEDEMRHEKQEVRKDKKIDYRIAS